MPSGCLSLVGLKCASLAPFVEPGQQFGAVTRPETQVQLVFENLVPCGSAGVGGAGHGEHQRPVGKSGHCTRLDGRAADLLVGDAVETTRRNLRWSCRRAAHKRLGGAVSSRKTRAAGGEDRMHVRNPRSRRSPPPGWRRRRRGTMRRWASRWPAPSKPFDQQVARGVLGRARGCLKWSVRRWRWAGSADVGHGTAEVAGRQGVWGCKSFAGY